MTLLIPPESCREGVLGILLKSAPTPCSSLPCPEWVFAVPCIAVSFQGGGRQGDSSSMAARTRVCPWPTPCGSVLGGSVPLRWAQSSRRVAVRVGNVAGAQLREICNGLPVLCVPDSSSEEEEDDEEEEEEEAEDYGTDGTDRLSSPALDESGLGLLARFAASAMPSPIVPPPLSIIQLEAKQKAKKKEERQSLMGECPGVGWWKVWDLARGGKVEGLGGPSSLQESRLCTQTLSCPFFALAAWS